MVRFPFTETRGKSTIAARMSFVPYYWKKQKKLKKILLIATGALTNSTTSQQGESIPGIAHAISIEI